MLWPFRKKEEVKKEEFNKYLPLKVNEREKQEEIPLREIKEQANFNKKSTEQILTLHKEETIPELKFPENKTSFPKLAEYNPEKIKLSTFTKPVLREVKIENSKNENNTSRDEERLIDFVRVALARGYNKDEIRNGLLSKGWPVKLVDKVLWKR